MRRHARRRADGDGLPLGHGPGRGAAGGEPPPDADAWLTPDHRLVVLLRVANMASLPGCPVPVDVDYFPLVSQTRPQGDIHD